MFNNSGRNPCQFLLFCFPLHWQLLQYDLSSTEVHIKNQKSLAGVKSSIL